jgi:Flp pilus assembly protein TadG
LAEAGGADRGAATAELAVVMPAVTVVLAAVLSVGQAVMAQVSCVDAARAGARAAARGDGLEQVQQTALAAVANGGESRSVGRAAVDVVPSGDVVTVTVSRRLRLMAFGPALRVSARAVAKREQPTGVATFP